MSVCTDCNKKNFKIVSTLENEVEKCETTIHETVCIQGTVTIEPKIEVGEVSTICVGNPMFEPCPGELKRTCEFTVSQEICVEIPLTFYANATAEEKGIVCNEPEIGPCTGTTACTHTIGFYKNNLDVTEALLDLAGGSITLGVGEEGLSYTVTNIDEAEEVLNFETPSPPAPEDPPFRQQYQNLYAQLLAANLNVIAIESEGVEICIFAIEAIENANIFLAESPEGGESGAPIFQEPLEKFNSGNAPGCPVHCVE